MNRSEYSDVEVNKSNSIKFENIFEPVQAKG